ncbi:MAG: hypothetical protein SPI13_05740, partial [Eubacteriales bacterium]|nr:hypothetical protein [Eubacteriales bacterium]
RHRRQRRARFHRSLRKSKSSIERLIKKSFNPADAGLFFYGYICFAVYFDIVKVIFRLSAEVIFWLSPKLRLFYP